MVEVALPPATGVHGKAKDALPAPQAEALAVTVPSGPTWRQRVPVPPAEETIRLVVEAVTDVSMVVEAYGKEEVPMPVTVSVPVAVRLARETFPENRPLPWTERVEAGEVVPMPTFPVPTI